MSRWGFISVRGGRGSENTKEGEGSTWKGEVALVCWEEGCLFPEMKWITPSPTTISVFNKMKWQSPQNFSRSSLNGNRWKPCGLQLECPSKMLRRRRKSPQSGTLKGRRAGGRLHCYSRGHGGKPGASSHQQSSGLVTSTIRPCVIS